MKPNSPKVNVENVKSEYKKFYILIFIFFSFILSFQLIALDIIILYKDSEINYSHENFEYFQDQKNILGLEEIQNLPISWTKMESKNLNPGFSNSTYWLRFKIKNNSDIVKTLYFNTGFSRLDYIEFFKETSPGEFTKIITGDNFPFGTREIKNMDFVFKLLIFPGETSSYYMMTKSKYNIITLNPEITTLESIQEESQKIIALYCIFYGFLIIMFFYNLSLSILIKEKIYIWFSLFILVYLFLNIGLHGMGFMYIYPNFPYLQNRDYQIFMPLTLVFGILFAMDFLEFKTKSSWGYEASKYLIMISLISSLTFPFFLIEIYPKFCNLFTGLNLICTSIFMFIIGVHLSFRKNKTAYFFLIGWSMLIIFTIIRALVVFTIIPTSPLALNSPLFGFSLTLVAFSIGLADRVNTLNSLLRIANEVLDEKVEERTMQLKKSLLEIHALKEKQDGDYYLTSLLIDPLSVNRTEGSPMKVDFFMIQKKQFHFKGTDKDIGGDICIADRINLNGHNYTVILNADAMGKSLQGASGVLIFSSVFLAVLTRTKSGETFENQSPETWLKNTYLELHKTFETFEYTMMVSAFIGLINESTGTIYYVNADHPRPILFRDGKAKFIQDETSLPKIGIPGGEKYFIIKNFNLNKYDIIIIGSDGKDDLLAGLEEKEMQSFEEEFLTHVENSSGDLKVIYELVLKTGEIIDDYSILRVNYRGVSDEVN